MKHPSRLATLTAAVALAGSALLAPSAANAAPILAEDTLSSSCTLTGGSLSWGVKESFRSYISGSIASGSWEVADGAGYETPSFSWTNPVGEVDAVTGQGIVSFTGSIHFTGHDGALDMILANPSIALSGDGTAQLLLDTKSQRATGEIAIDETQAYIGKIEGIGQTDPASGAIAFESAPAVLTSDGATAFGDYYSSGDELDPLTLSVQLGPCEGTPAQVVEEPTEAEAIAAPVEAPAQQSFPWLPVIVGGIAVLVIGVTGGMLFAGRKKAPAAAAESATADPGDG